MSLPSLPDLLPLLLLLALVLGGLGLVRGPRWLQRGTPSPAVNELRAARRIRQGTLAATAGVGAVAGSALAHAAAGLAALPWMWLTALAAAGALGIEAWLGPASPLPAAGGGRGRARPLGWLTPLHGLLAALALTVGVAMLAVGEAGEVVAGLGGLPAGAATITMALVAAPLLVAPRRAGRNTFIALAPFWIAAWTLLCVALVVLDEAHRLQVAHAWREAFALEGGAPFAAGATGGLLATAVHVGLSRALLAGPIGLGIVPAAELGGNNPAGRRRGASAAALAPLVGGLVVSSATMLAFAGVAVPRAERIDDRPLTAEQVAEGIDPDLLSPRMHIPGPAHGRGLLPHLELGQMIVLPEDTPLEDGKRYPMRFHAQPRGHRTGTINVDRNVVSVPNWQVAGKIDTVVFRAREPGMARHAAFDRRIAVEATLERAWKREELDRPPEAREDLQVWALSPVDPEVDLTALAKTMDGPYVVLDDFHFVGTVRRAWHQDYGECLVMYEERPDDAPEDPVLRTVVSLGYAGPFFDDEPDRPAPPLVLASAPGFSAPPGTLLEMRMQSPPRGLPIGEIVRDFNKDGELRAPPWDFLAQTTHARLRHREDPTRDLRVPVHQRLAEDGSLRFWSADTSIVKFKHAARMREFRDITLEVPDYAFEVEVRSSAQLPHTLADRVALVPLHPQPYGERSGEGIYRPHPVEVFASDMMGPFRVQGPGRWLGTSMRAGFGDVGVARILAALCLVMLGASALVVVSATGGRALEAALGEGAASGFQLAFIAAAAASPLLLGDGLVSLAVALICMAGALGAVILLLRLRAEDRP